MALLILIIDPSFQENPMDANMLFIVTDRNLFSYLSNSFFKFLIKYV